MENNIFELQYAIDTFYFLICGALVMWMAAGFAMLEACMVRAKNTAEILTKNIALFAVACIMYMLMGYSIMYPGDDFVGGWFNALANIGVLGSSDNSVETVAAGDAFQGRRINSRAGRRHALVEQGDAP